MPVATHPNVVVTLKMAVLRKNRPNGAVFHAVTRFDHSGCRGISEEFGSMISPLDFSAADTIHSSGNSTISTDTVTRK
jgi:hypothetical protein